MRFVTVTARMAAPVFSTSITIHRPASGVTAWLAHSAAAAHLPPPPDEAKPCPTTLGLRESPRVNSSTLLTEVKRTAGGIE
jgi:hypothetical protein